MNNQLFKNVVLQIKIYLKHLGEDAKKYSFDLDQSIIHVSYFGMHMFDIDLSGFTEDEILDQEMKWCEYLITIVQDYCIEKNKTCTENICF